MPPVRVCCQGPIVIACPAYGRACVGIEGVIAHEQIGAGEPAEAALKIDIVRRIAVLAALAVTLVANWAANALPINDQTTGDVAARFDLALDPATWAFSIWGVIYAGLLAFAIFQALPSQRENPRLRAIALPFIVSSLANAGWIVLWHYNHFGWSVLAMAVILASLLMVYLKLEIGRSRVGWPETLLVRVPFGLYLGWITVAAILNVSIALVDAGWEGGGIAPETWAVIMIGVAMVIAATIGFSRRDLAYTAAVAWALVAIMLRQADTPMVAWSAGAAAVIAVGSALLGLIRRRNGRDIVPRDVVPDPRDVVPTY
jgi:translocator protein